MGLTHCCISLFRLTFGPCTGFHLVCKLLEANRQKSIYVERGFWVPAKLHSVSGETPAILNASYLCARLLCLCYPFFLCWRDEPRPYSEGRLLCAEQYLDSYRNGNVYCVEELEKLSHLEAKAIKTKAKAKQGKTRELCSDPYQKNHKVKWLWVVTMVW